METQNRSGDSPPLVELEFSLRDSAYYVVRVSEDLGCRVELLDTIYAPEDERKLFEFYRIESGDEDTIVEQATSCDMVRDHRVIALSEDECVAEVLLTEDCVIGIVAEEESLLQSIEAVNGEARITVVILPHREPDEVTDELLEEHPSLQLVAQRQSEYVLPLLTNRSVKMQLKQQLTDRQWRALRLAYVSGYFDRPRQVSQRELGGMMDVSQETYSQHLRDALENLLRGLFEEGLLTRGSPDEEL